ncbi:MAG: fluoride efflux transporter CrcB [Pseudomonadota bacterium]
MNELVAIGLGGALGAVARHGVAHVCNLLFGTQFPYGTLVVNVVGSFLIGILFVLLVERALLPPVWRSVLIVGFLGAFTTFSTFSLQTLALFEEGRAGAALVYVGASVIVCVLAAALGLALARQLPG